MAVQLIGGNHPASFYAKLTKNGVYGDGGGLWLKVTNDGVGKSWLFRWTVPGTKREKVMGLGSARTVDLGEAREKARECRKQLLAGKDPLVERDGARLDIDIAAGLAKTVSQVADEYFEAKIRRKSPGYRKLVTLRLRKYVHSTIGDMPIEKVDTRILLEKTGLQRLWIEQHPTGVSLHSILMNLFRLAIANKYYTRDNPAAWINHLEHILPIGREVHRPKSHASLPFKDVGRFMEVLRAYQYRSKAFIGHGHPNVALWVEFVVLTAVRLSEVRLATWAEFDIENMIWNVPPEHRKTGRDGVTKQMPITPHMLEVLQEMQKRRSDPSPNALVFPSNSWWDNASAGGGRGKAFNGDSASQFIKKSLKWDIKITSHGFRSTFVDWARSLDMDERLIQLQLDHVSGSKSDRAYGHNKLLERRRTMMLQWGDYCSRPAPEPVADNVLSIADRRKA